MQWASITSLALFVASAIAQGSSNANPFNIPQGGYALTAGKPSTITWKPTTSGPVTLTLREGASSDLTKGTVIAQSITNSGSFTYTPPSNTVRNSDYTIEISSDTDPSAVNYTPQFVIESTNTVESASAASSGSSATSAASSSAASSASASSASASSTASSASASSASSKKSAAASSTANSASGAATTGSSSTTTSAEKAPSSGANSKNIVNGGLAAMAMGAALVL